MIRLDSGGGRGGETPRRDTSGRGRTSHIHRGECVRGGVINLPSRYPQLKKTDNLSTNNDARWLVQYEWNVDNAKYPVSRNSTIVYLNARGKVLETHDYEPRYHDPLYDGCNLGASIFKKDGGGDDY